MTDLYETLVRRQHMRAVLVPLAGVAIVGGLLVVVAWWVTG